MALRVARGLFRLWLVLSVLWIGGVGVVTWYSFPFYEDWGGIPIEEKVDRPQVRRDDSPSKPVQDAELPDAPWVLERRAAIRFERRAAIRFATVIALVPPALLLALGSALVWAFRGFR